MPVLPSSAASTSSDDEGAPWKHPTSTTSHPVEGSKRVTLHLSREDRASGPHRGSGDAADDDDGGGGGGKGDEDRNEPREDRSNLRRRASSVLALVLLAGGTSPPPARPAASAAKIGRSIRAAMTIVIVISKKIAAEESSKEEDRRGRCAFRSNEGKLYHRCRPARNAQTFFLTAAPRANSSLSTTGNSEG
jgi:hypothetical protein